uniref:Uncharacterized protein n=1 Tax=Timspurckia oligopyrenoides TaxID=708627 RepID=A0A7S0ZEU6_9RHOD|mmetsp:Transcript_2535/g.4459  ORF Transcript_2535/g.4459 Transcript_2535/m.4459 type:complete len:175 (+) Transcript_2535:186-710(+)
MGSAVGVKKRDWGDAMRQETNPGLCSRAWGFALPAELMAAPVKRIRLSEQQETTSLSSSSSAADGSASESTVDSAVDERSEMEMKNNILKLVPRKKRSLLQKHAVRDSEPVFSMKDMKSVVKAAVKDSEDKLRDEFRILLQNRLDEQWSVFTRYTEDFLARQRNASTRELTYLS